MEETKEAYNNQSFLGSRKHCTHITLVALVWRRHRLLWIYIAQSLAVHCAARAAYYQLVSETGDKESNQRLIWQVPEVISGQAPKHAVSKHILHSTFSSPFKAIRLWPRLVKYLSLSFEGGEKLKKLSTSNFCVLCRTITFNQEVRCIGHCLVSLTLWRPWRHELFGYNLLFYA